MPPEDDMRSAIAAALDTHAADPVDDTAAPEPARRDVSGPEHGEVVGEATEVAPAGERVRDSLGRFVPKAGETTTSDEKAPAAAQPTAPATPSQEAQATPGQEAATPAEPAAPARAATPDPRPLRLRLQSEA